VASLSPSGVLLPRTRTLLRECGRELGADADDRVSSEVGLSVGLRETLAKE
jgi:hypothetical protein